MGSHLKHIWEQISQWNYNENLAQKGKENRLFFLVQRLENGLSHVLQIHENEGRKVGFQCWNGIFYQEFIRAENSDQVVRDKDDHAPHHCCINQDHHRQSDHCLTHKLRSSGSVIVTEDGGGSLIYSVNWSLDHLTDTGHNGHYRYVNIPSGDSQNVVTADSYKAVCQLHNEARTAKTDDVFGVFYAAFQLCFFQKTGFHFCSFFQEKKHI